MAELDGAGNEFAELIDRVSKGDDEAISVLWDRYYRSLVRIAARKLPGGLKRTGDEEDVALSAFHSFVAGVREQRFPDLSTPDNLWGLMMTLTARKVHAHVRRQTRQKRGGGNVRGESVFMEPNRNESSVGISKTAGDVTPPDLSVQLAEASEQLLIDLDDDQLRTIALMRMDGYLVNEIAVNLELSKRAVERRLQLIRKIWSERAEQ